MSLFFEINQDNDEDAIKELADIDIEEVILALVKFIGVENNSFERIREAKES